MESLTSSILQFIQQNSEWAWGVVFLIAFAESIAIIGMMVPGWLLLVGIGTLIGTNVLPFLPIALSAYLGAVIGEYLSFFIGYKYHQRVLQLSIIEKHQPLLEKSKIFFKRYGNSGIFFGRFVGPLRAVLPFVAGVLQMPKSTFNLINLTSGLIWAPLYLTPGILAGAAYKLDKELSLEVGFILMMILLIAWFAFRQGKKLVFKVLKKEETQTDIKNHSILYTNFSLSLLILITTIIIFIKSHYFIFILDLANVLFVI